MAPVHPKVKSSSAAAAVAGVIVWLLGRFVLHGEVDPVIQAEIFAAVPAALAFAAGWLTPSPPPPEPPGPPQEKMAPPPPATP